ncbi:MAG: TolC family protein [Kiritimatiellae bacterium]|nr:TolC family protein [Kiritimatiellia bacterium]
MFFGFKKSALCALALAAMAGCDTIDRAITAQEEVEAMSADDGGDASLPSEFVDLTKFTLPEYVEYALSNRPDVISARLAVSNACLKLVSVTSGEYPIFGASGGYSQSTHNNGPHFSWRQSGDANASLRMELLLCDFGRLDAQELEAMENIVAAQRDYADVQLAVFEDVAGAYFSLLRNDALLAVACTNEQQYAEHLRQAQSLFDAGEVKNLDVLKAKLDLSDAHLKTITASNDVITASADFIRALGLKADVADRLDVLPPRADSLGSPKRELPVSDLSVTDALAFARTNAPSLMVLRAKVRAASARVDYAVADLLPSLSLDASFKYVDPAWNFSWGVTAIQSLFEGFRKTTAVDSAIVDLLAARESVFLAEQQLSCNLAKAVATRDTAMQALDNACIQVKQAQENLDNVIAQYRVGEASRIDFTDAASAFSEAEGARIKAFFAGQIAEALLVRLTGAGVEYGDRE